MFVSTTSLSGASIPFGLEGLSVVGTASAPAPPVPPAPVVTAPATFTLSPASAIGGGLPVVGMVTLNCPAPVGNAIVIVSSSNPALASVPGSIITIGAGFSTASFPINTAAVTAVTTVVLSASYNGVTVNANLVLVPAFSLASVTLAAPSTVGGTFDVGTVHLTSPSGSALVTLSTSNPLLANVSHSVLVPAGLTSVGFAVSTQPVSGTVLISGTLGGVTKSAALTLTAR